MDILIVDDNQANVDVIVAIVNNIGHNPVCAYSGNEALDIIDTMPDLVILDVSMPGLDGYQTATSLKDKFSGEHLPIIFLTASVKEDTLHKCLAVGDDYISKPINIEEVISKINVHLRIVDQYKKLKQQNYGLMKSKVSTENELRIVENIFKHQFQHYIKKVENIRFHLSPMSVFNGDVLLATTGPNGNLYLCIGDVTGHGLPAAIGAMPVYATFRTMAQKGCTVGLIASQMNAALRPLLPDNMMLAASIMEYSTSEQTLTVWSGGMPTMYIENGKGQIKHCIHPRHPPLAMLENYEFSQDVDIYAVQAGDRAYLFTDGVEESRNNNEEMFGEERLMALFNNGGNIFDSVIQSLKDFTVGTNQDDDITLIELTFTETSTPQKEEPDRELQYALPWQLNLNLSSEKIRKAEPIPQIVKLLSNAVGFNIHQDFISTILSELYSNALEHGLLKLDSSMKQTEDGFLDYYQQRSERLSKLESGLITISIDFQPDDAEVIIIINDSGDGIDSDQARTIDNDLSFGRGVSIINSLCKDVEYSNNGSTVKVIYPIKPA